MPKLLNLPPARILLTLREWFDYKISHCVLKIWLSIQTLDLFSNSPTKNLIFNSKMNLFQVPQQKIWFPIPLLIKNFMYFIFSKIKMCVFTLKEIVCFIVSKLLSLTLCHRERRRSEPVDNTAVTNLLHFNLSQCFFLDYFLFFLYILTCLSVFFSDFFWTCYTSTCFSISFQLFLSLLHFNLSQYFFQISFWTF